MDQSYWIMEACDCCSGTGKLWNGRPCFSCWGTGIRWNEYTVSSADYTYTSDNTSGKDAPFKWVKDAPTTGGEG